MNFQSFLDSRLLLTHCWFFVYTSYIKVSYKNLLIFKSLPLFFDCRDTWVTLTNQLFHKRIVGNGAGFCELCIFVCIQCFDTVGWVAGRHPACKKTEWWGAGMVICLERGADLHMPQLMPLPLTVSCFSKIKIGFTFLVPAHPGSPGQRAVKRVCVCVCVRALPRIFVNYVSSCYRLESVVSEH